VGAVGVGVKMEMGGMLDTWKSGSIYSLGLEEMFQHNTQSHTNQDHVDKSYPVIWYAMMDYSVHSC
jgi:hypothetical protein